jgi:DNA-binding HxlR family transcriptional regulator
MAKRDYGQFCGMVRAMEMVGERWAMLIVRDLLVGPKRYTDLHQGLPGIPTNILSTRLKELEEAGVVRRRVQPRTSGGGVVYELTEYGNELEDIVIRLGRWGAKSLTMPRPDEVITVDSMVMAFRSTFCHESARGVTASYEVRLGPIILHIRIVKGKLTVAGGPLPDADLVIEAGPGIKMLMTGEMTPAEAIASGSVRLTGDPALLATFAEIFRI